MVLAATGVDVDGLPSADPTPTLNAWNLADRPYLLFLGRVHPIKRLDLLAHAIGRLRSRAFRLVVAGPDEGGHRAQLEPLFAQSGVEVVWTGPVDGAANEALVAFIAERLDVARRDVRIVAGVTSRTKTVEVAGVASSDVERLIDASAEDKRR